MTDAAIVALIAVFIVAGIYLSVRYEDTQVLRSRMRATVIVSVADAAGLELAFAGTLITYDRRTLVLRNAKQLTANGEVPIDGELILTWDRVSFVQRP